MDNEENNGGFDPISKTFKENPTVENYVYLRRKFPDKNIQIAISSGIEWLFANEDLLKSFNIPSSLVTGALDADFNSISELSLILLERIIERKEIINSGQTHAVSRRLVISDPLINFLINLMLDSLDWNDNLEIPRDLIILLRERIGGEISKWDKIQKTNELRTKAIIAVLKISASGEKPTYRKIGEELGVNSSTVMRWFSEKEGFDELIKASIQYIKPSSP